LLEHARQLRTQGRRIERRIECVEPGDEARHVRALGLGRQRHVQVPQRRGGLRSAGHLDRQRVAHVLDADALDHQPAVVTAALRVRDVQGVGEIGHR